MEEEREEVETTMKRVRISEEAVEIIVEREEAAHRPPVVTEKAIVVPRDIEDDWFLLLESVPVEVKAPPAGRQTAAHKHNISTCTFSLSITHRHIYAYSNYTLMKG